MTLSVPPSHDNEDDLQKAAHDWAAASFGADAVNNRKERGMRVVEEALELGQTCGVSIEDIMRLALRVYAGSPGAIAKEVGDVGLTLGILAHSVGLSATSCTRWGLLAAVGKPADFWRDRHEKKVALGIAKPLE